MPGMWLRVLAVAVVIGGVVGLGSMPAAADDHDEDDDDSSVVNVTINLDEVVDALRDLLDELTDFTGDFTELVTEVLMSVFWQPFITLLRAVASTLLGLMVWLPETTIEEVRRIHWAVFQVTLVLGAAGYAVIGIVYIGYDPFGIPYARVRPLIPRLTAALVFGGVAPWLLQYPVDVAEAAAAALLPADPSFTGLLLLSGELVAVSFIEAFIVLGVVAVFTVQKIYILFAVAAAPLIAWLWAVPSRYTRSAADNLIGAFYGFLLISPLDVIVFRLTVALLGLSGFDAPDWILGFGGTLLLLGVPLLVVPTGVAAAGPAFAAARGAVSTVRNRYRAQNQRGTHDRDLTSGQPRRPDYDHHDNRRTAAGHTGGNRFGGDR